MLPTTNLVRLRHLLGEVYTHNWKRKYLYFLNKKRLGVPDTHFIDFVFVTNQIHRFCQKLLRDTDEREQFSTLVAYLYCKSAKDSKLAKKYTFKLVSVFADK